MKNTASAVPMVLFLVLAFIAMVLFVNGVVEASVVCICCLVEAAIKYTEANEEVEAREAGHNSEK